LRTLIIGQRARKPFDTATGCPQFNVDGNRRGAPRLRGRLLAEESTTQFKTVDSGASPFSAVPARPNAAGDRPELDFRARTHSPRVCSPGPWGQGGASTAQKRSRTNADMDGFTLTNPYEDKTRGASRAGETAPIPNTTTPRIADRRLRNNSSQYWARRQAFGGTTRLAHPGTNEFGGRVADPGPAKQELLQSTRKKVRSDERPRRCEGRTQAGVRRAGGGSWRSPGEMFRGPLCSTPSTNATLTGWQGRGSTTDGTRRRRRGPRRPWLRLPQ